MTVDQELCVFKKTQIPPLCLNNQIFLNVKISVCVDVCARPPLSGQGLGFRPKDHQSVAGTWCRGRLGEVCVQRTRLPVQRLHPHGPRHITLDWTGAGSAL